MASYQKRPGISTVFVRASTLPTFGNPVYGTELSMSLIEVVGRENVDTVQKINGVWRLSVKNPKSRMEVLRREITVRKHSISVSNENPLLMDGEETVRIIISNIPSSVADEEIRNALILKGLKLGKSLRHEMYRDYENHLMSVKTGRRIVHIAPPKDPLPKSITVANIFIGYITQPKERKETDENHISNPGSKTTPNKDPQPTPGHDQGSKPKTQGESEELPGVEGIVPVIEPQEGSEILDAGAPAMVATASLSVPPTPTIAISNRFNTLAPGSEDKEEEDDKKKYDASTDEDEGSQAGDEGESLGPASDAVSESVSVNVSETEVDSPVSVTDSSVQLTLFGDRARPRTRSAHTKKGKKSSKSKSRTSARSNTPTPKRKGSVDAKTSHSKNRKVEKRESQVDAISSDQVQGAVTVETQASPSQSMTPDWFGSPDC